MYSDIACKKICIAVIMQAIDDYTQHIPVPGISATVERKQQYNVLMKHKKSAIYFLFKSESALLWAELGGIEYVIERIRRDKTLLCKYKERREVVSKSQMKEGIV